MKREEKLKRCLSLNRVDFLECLHSSKANKINAAAIFRLYSAFIPLLNKNFEETF